MQRTKGIAPPRLLALVTALLLAAGPGWGQSCLGTTFASNNGAAGNMFNVVAASAVTITSFELNLDPGIWNVEIRIVTGGGGHQGLESSPAAWTLVGAQTGVTSVGANAPTALGTGVVSVPIPAGGTQGFYVTTTVVGAGIMNYTNGSNFGGVVAMDGSIAVTEGTGNAYLFGSVFGGLGTSSRIFNGGVCYAPAVTSGGGDPSSVSYHGLGCGSAEPSTLAATTPEPGEVFNLSVGAGPASTPGTLLFSLPPAAPFNVLGCDLFIDLFDFLAIPFGTDQNGAAEFAATMPASIGTVGFDFNMQVGFPDPVNGFQLSNGLTGRLRPSGGTSFIGGGDPPGFGTPLDVLLDPTTSSIACVPSTTAIQFWGVAPPVVAANGVSLLFSVGTTSAAGAVRSVDMGPAGACVISAPVGGPPGVASVFSVVPAAATPIVAATPALLADTPVDVQVSKGTGPAGGSVACVRTVGATVFFAVPTGAVLGSFTGTTSSLAERHVAANATAAVSIGVTPAGSGTVSIFGITEGTSPTLTPVMVSVATALGGVPLDVDVTPSPATIACVQTTLGTEFYSTATGALLAAFAGGGTTNSPRAIDMTATGAAVIGDGVTRIFSFANPAVPTLLVADPVLGVLQDVEISPGGALACVRGLADEATVFYAMATGARVAQGLVARGSSHADRLVAMSATDCVVIGNQGNSGAQATIWDITSSVPYLPFGGTYPSIGRPRDVAISPLSTFLGFRTEGRISIFSLAGIQVETLNSPATIGAARRHLAMSETRLVCIGTVGATPRARSVMVFDLTKLL